MVNLFYNSVLFYTFTTVVFYFLPMNYISSAGNSNGRVDAMYKYDDGKVHALSDRVYYLKSSQYVSPDTSLIAAIYVEELGTIVNAHRITVYGNDPNKISAYGAYVRNGGKLNLITSNFRDIPGLRAQNAVISMIAGEISGTSHAVYASGREADIDLVSVNIDIAPNNLNVKGIGIVSDFGATVKISESTVTFNQCGSFSTRFGGRYLLNTMFITGKGQSEETIIDGDGAMGRLPEAFQVSQGGDVHLKRSTIQLKYMHGFLIKNFLGYVNENGKVLQKYNLSDGFKDTNIKVERSNIYVQGEGAYGLRFNIFAPEELAEALRKRDDEKLFETEKVIIGKAFVYLSQTNMTVPDGVAIYAKGAKDYGVTGVLELSEETKISGDLLLKAENNSSLLVKASASSLIGGTRVEDISAVDLELARGSTWYIKKSQSKGLQASNSSLSSISLSDSTIIFDEDISDGYQTLRIGKKTNHEKNKAILSAHEKAYSATGDAQIKLNTFLNDEGFFDSQKTDRILIYGDVSGTTLIHMQNFLKMTGKEIHNGKDQSISLIQVSGMAQEDSFKLSGEYATIGGFPYQYYLRGYGPGSSFGEADPKNRLVEGDGKFWDFRLEGIYMNPEGDSFKTVSVTYSLPEPVEPSSSGLVPTLSTPVSSPLPISSDTEDSSSPDAEPTASSSESVEPSSPPIFSVKTDFESNSRIRAVVPQVPTYFLLPNALFHAGLMDLISQNKKLEIMRGTSHGSLQSDQNTAFFISSYGGGHHYASNLSAFEYGYGAELDYTALEAGILLKEIESLYSRALFGVMGTYGSLSLNPQDVEYSKKSPFDRWSVSVYGGLQNDMGLYMGGVFSYGLFRGDVFTIVRDKTATLKGKQFNVSLTGGKTFTMRHKGIFFDPQIQLIYQSLQFDRVRDVDNLDVDLGKLDQWIARFGGRFTKVLSSSEEGRVVSFYNKLYLSRSFEEKQVVSFKKDFQLGAFGSSLEAGLGFNAQLSSKFALHGDVTYQRRLTKAGFSGVSFSAGLRHFF
ncbi:hypothetical protein ABID23_001523 [Bartonella silvatica]|uniref:Autotransporter domain-containing protein n=1 Tax=Bartonella silvatica TaxID=357760 RepID=A0ABV2HIN2_9HYPH